MMSTLRKQEEENAQEAVRQEAQHARTAHTAPGLLEQTAQLEPVRAEQAAHIRRDLQAHRGRVPLPAHSPQHVPRRESAAHFVRAHVRRRLPREMR